MCRCSPNHTTPQLHPALPCPLCARPCLQHKAGTLPALAVRATAQGYPAKTTGALGTDGSSDTTSWGHLKPEASPMPQLAS